MRPLSDAEIAAFLEREPEWKFADGKLAREWKFSDFAEAMKFVNETAVLAEKAGHHPDIDIRYNLVRLGLVTHDAGGVTKKDTAMAERLSQGFYVPSNVEGSQ